MTIKAETLKREVTFYLTPSLAMLGGEGETPKEEGDIELFITLVPIVLKYRLLIFLLNNFGNFL